MGARGLCKAEVGVRFPSPPLEISPIAGGGRVGETDGMTRFLLATMSAAGHVGPLVPIAHELVALVYWVYC